MLRVKTPPAPPCFEESLLFVSRLEIRVESGSISPTGGRPRLAISTRTHMGLGLFAVHGLAICRRCGTGGLGALPG